MCKFDSFVSLDVHLFGKFLLCRSPVIKLNYLYLQLKKYIFHSLVKELGYQANLYGNCYQTYMLIYLHNKGYCWCHFTVSLSMLCMFLSLLPQHSQGHINLRVTPDATKTEIITLLWWVGFCAVVLWNMPPLFNWRLSHRGQVTPYSVLDLAQHSCTQQQVDWWHPITRGRFDAYEQTLFTFEPNANYSFQGKTYLDMSTNGGHFVPVSTC